MTLARFTLDGSDALEARLGALGDRVRAGVQEQVPASRLEAILLGGGYGRGEGGVLRTSGGDLPYNDFESFVLVRGNPVLAERRYREPLHALGEGLSPDAGLDVEFKVLTRERLRQSPTTMFYYDLVMGHRFLLGNDSVLAGCDHHRDASRIPLHEATRLLMNRCSGLLFSLARLRREPFEPADADFVGRNLAKAQLAFGDVVLTAAGRYHWSCRERNARLRTLAAEPAGLLSGPDRWAHGEELIAHHDAGVRFKLHPRRSTATREQLASEHHSLVALGQRLWLRLESRRLETSFATPEDYAGSPIHKCPETASFRNRLINLRSFGIATALRHGGARHPRERLLHSLPRLLWSSKDNSLTLTRVQRDLRAPGADFAGLVAAYGALWGRFN